MPYRWTDTPTAPDAPLARLKLWPHQSLTPSGFVTFIGVTAAMLSFPLLAVIGSPVIWGLLVFMLAALWGVWKGITRNQRDRSVNEALTLYPDRIHLEHKPAYGPAKEWDANPYWVDVELHENDERIEKYLTLKGNGRRVELGAFLTPEERAELYVDLRARLNGLAA